MAYDDLLKLWIQIYEPSDNGAGGVQSIYGATILDTLDWMTFVDKGAAVGMRLLNDYEFQVAARGSNEETNQTGSTDPVTANNYLDTAGRRMASYTGIMGMCGRLWAWILDQSTRFDMPMGDSEVRTAGATATIYHAATPGGNPVYLKFDSAGNPYLACNMAAAGADKVISLGTTARLVIKHEVAAATGGYQIYMNRSGTDPGKILCNISNLAKNVFIHLSYPEWFLQIVHDASASTNGVAVSFDDGADNRLEATFSNSATNTFDTCYFGPVYGAYDLPGAKGSLYKYGTYGDVKLLAGGTWSFSSSCGSRARFTYNYRWSTSSYFGGRFAVPGL
jgi:hypothetical protein